MGGLAGSMAHLYGDKGLKFSELASIIRRVASGDLAFNEKADGQNIHATMDLDRNVYFARNKTDYNMMGRSAEAIQQDYLNKGFVTQAEIFGDGCRAIEAVLQSISEEMLNFIFNDPRMPMTYINCEIIHKKHPNLVVYDKNHIQFHQFKTMAKTDYDKKSGVLKLNSKFERFLPEVEGQAVEVSAYEGTTKANPSGNIAFTVEGPQFLPPPTQNMSPEDIELFNQQVSDAIGNITELMNSAGITDQSTIGDYLIAKIEDEVLPALNVSNTVISDVSHYIVYGTDASGTVISNKKELGSTLKPFKNKLQSALGKEMADKLTLGKYKSFQNGLAGVAIAPLKEIIHNFSLSIVNAAESVIASDPGMAKYATKQAISDMESVRQAVIQSYSDDPDRLERNLAKFERELELLGDVESFSQSMEGVVISYIREDGMPMQYKLTGNFAPANQLLGMSAQGFEIKRNLLNKAKEEYTSINYNPTEEDDSNPVNESKIRKMIRHAIKSYLFESTSPVSKLQLPDIDSGTPSEIFARSGEHIGYSPIQDADKLIEPIITSGLLFFPPTTAVTGVYLSAKTLGSITKDIISIFLDESLNTTQKKKSMYNYIKDKGIEQTVSSLPVGKIPGSQRIAASLSKKAYIIAEKAYQMMVESVKEYGQEVIKKSTEI